MAKCKKCRKKEKDLVNMGKLGGLVCAECQFDILKKRRKK